MMAGVVLDEETVRRLREIIGDVDALSAEIHLPATMAAIEHDQLRLLTQLLRPVLQRKETNDDS